MIAVHLAALRAQLDGVRAGMALAVMAGRAFILPQAGGRAGGRAGLEADSEGSGGGRAQRASWPACQGRPTA